MTVLRTPGSLPLGPRGAASARTTEGGWVAQSFSIRVFSAAPSANIPGEGTFAVGHLLTTNLVSQLSLITENPPQNQTFGN